MRGDSNSRPEVRAKISKAHRERVAKGLCHLWKGEGVSYYAIHLHLVQYYGKASKCQNRKCIYPRFNSKGVYIEKPKRYEWANMTGNYTRNKEDYKQLCPSCHRQFDLGLIKLDK